MRDVGAYRVVARPLFAGSLDRSGSFSLRPNPLDGAGGVRPVRQAARATSQGTLGRLHLFLALGVLGGTGLAFLAGFAVARRAMRPIAGLTQAAREVARTRDPAMSLPKPRGQRRGGGAGRHAGGHAARARRRPRRDRGRAGAPARVRGRRLPRAAHPAHQHPGQPRAARGRARPQRAARATARPRPRSRARRCARRTGCGGWWATCCCWPAPTPARATAPAARPRRTSLRSCATPRARPRRWRRATRDARPAPEGEDLRGVEGSADDLHRLVLNLIENAFIHTPAGYAGRRLGAPRRRGASCSRWPTAGPACRRAMRDRVFERFAREGGDARPAAAAWAWRSCARWPTPTAAR